MIANCTTLKLNDLGRNRYHDWPNKDDIFIFHRRCLGGEGIGVYPIGEIPQLWAIFYEEDIEEIVNIDKIMSYEELM